MKSIPVISKNTGNPLRVIVLAGAVLALAACNEKPRPLQPQVTPLFQQERGALGKAGDVEQGLVKGAEDAGRKEQEQAR